MIKVVNKKKYIIVILTLIIVVTAVKVVSFCSRKKSLENVSVEAVNYLSNASNRRKNIDEAARLNSGSYMNTCVYFAAGALRNAGLNVPSSVGNTSQFIEFLQKEGCSKSYNLDELQPGDVCFTSPSGNVNEVPDHTYIFMKWADSSHRDAYICDNQLNEYGSCYHLRNITYKTVRNGKSKSKAIFFIRIK